MQIRDTYPQDEHPLEAAWRGLHRREKSGLLPRQVLSHPQRRWRRAAFVASAGLSRHVALAVLPKDVDVGSGLLESGAADQSTCTSPRKSGAGHFRSFRLREHRLSNARFQRGAGVAIRRCVAREVRGGLLAWRRLLCISRFAMDRAQPAAPPWPPLFCDREADVQAPAKVPARVAGGGVVLE